MELYQLQVFVIVAEAANITRAARRLYTTPSTVSMHIKALEEELGVELFTRSNQGMAITPKGEQLLAKALTTLNAAQDLVNHATDIQAALMGQVSIGMCSDPSMLNIPQLVQGLHRDCPGIDLLLEQSSTMHILKAVAEGDLNIGFAYGEITHPVLEAQYLTQVELVVVLPATWTLDFDPASWEALAAQPWLHTSGTCPFQQVVEGHLTAQGLACQYHVQSDNERSRYELVKAGIGLSLLERDAAEQGVQAGVLRIASVEPLYVPLSLVYRAHEYHQPLLHCVIDIITALFDRRGRVSSS